MTEVSYLSLLIAGELLVILSLACGILLFRSIHNKKRDYQAARKLVAAVKDDEDRHTTSIHKLLESGYKYEGEELEQTVRDLIRAEKMFYQTLINTYLKRDAETFGHLNITLEALTDIYEQLKVPADQRRVGGLRQRRGSGVSPGQEPTPIRRVKRDHGHHGSDVERVLQHVGRQARRSR